MVTQRISRDGCRAGGPPVRGIAAAAAFGLAVGLAGCVPAEVTRPEQAEVATRWDHRPEADAWTAAALNAVAERDAVLASRVPGDIAAWCPGYETASLSDRRAFWVGLMSAVAKHESSWNPQASGAGGRYIGLMQISPQTARRNGCDATTAGALKDGGANLACAVDVFAQDVARDGLVAGKGSRGIGRQWGPFRKSDKRQEMAAWTSKQDYCAKG